jgi:2'-hydroxyisoflavone reductase
MDEAHLLEQQVAPWSELPLWIPQTENGIFEVRNDKAIAAGLRFRPLHVTARDTLEWDRAMGSDRPLRAGLSRDREEQLLRDAPHSSH